MIFLIMYFICFLFLIGIPCLVAIIFAANASMEALEGKDYGAQQKNELQKSLGTILLVAIVISVLMSFLVAFFLFDGWAGFKFPLLGYSWIPALQIGSLVISLASVLFAIECLVNYRKKHPDAAKVISLSLVLLFVWWGCWIGLKNLGMNFDLRMTKGMATDEDYVVYTFDLSVYLYLIVSLLMSLAALKVSRWMVGVQKSKFEILP